jgi:hypothetical protein
MKSVEDQAVAGIELDDDAVMQFLLQNPDFFMRNARLVEQMRVPIPFAAPYRWSSGIWLASAITSIGWKKKSRC